MLSSNKPPFTIPLTSEDEYWAGYFRADGSICKNNYISSFSQKDKTVVDAFAEHIRCGNPITTSSLSGYGPQTITRLATTRITQDLLRLGVKSSLNHQLYLSKHFWRGMIDGDGSVMVTGRGDPALMLCGSQEDIGRFVDYCLKIIGGNRPKLYTRCSIWYARFGTRRAGRLAQHLYVGEYSANSRKRDIALSFEEYNHQ